MYQSTDRERKPFWTWQETDSWIWLQAAWNRKKAEWITEGCHDSILYSLWKGFRTVYFSQT